eukprot:6531315-Prymnesium_polylepis.2
MWLPSIVQRRDRRFPTLSRAKTRISSGGSYAPAWSRSSRYVPREKKRGLGTVPSGSVMFSFALVMPCCRTSCAGFAYRAGRRTRARR